MGPHKVYKRSRADDGAAGAVYGAYMLRYAINFANLFQNLIYSRKGACNSL